MPKTCRNQRPLLLLVFIVTLLVDQASKLLVLRYLPEGKTVNLIGSLLYLRRIGNPGAALSFLSNHTWIFTVVSTVAVIAIAYYAGKVTSKAWGICFGALGGGAAGNLVDRLTQPPAFGQGHVVDFIGYWDFFVGNVADIFIVVSVCVMMLLTLKGVPINQASQSDCPASEKENEKAADNATAATTETEADPKEASEKENESAAKTKDDNEKGDSEKSGKES